MDCDWCSNVLFAIISIIILSYTSTKVNFLVKFIFLYSAYMATSAFIVLIFWFRVRDPANAVFVANWIMKYVHRMSGVEFEIEGAELLKCPTAAVVVLNHQSSIDLMSLFEIWPHLENAGPIAKRELLYFQPFGLACWMCGAEFINRKSKTSHADINDMGHRAKAEGKKLMIFPEGTRNGAKGLSMLPFKKGAFHIAIDGKLPILPVVLSEYDFLDTKKMIFNRGKVTIKVLPRIDTSEYNKENIDELVTLTRDKMLGEFKNISKAKAE